MESDLSCLKTRIILFSLLVIGVYFPKIIHSAQIGAARLPILTAIQAFDSKRVHWPITDTLFVTGLYAATNTDTLCALSFDVMEIMRSEAQYIQRIVAQALKIKTDQVTVYCTHTHSSCAVSGFDLDLLSNIASKTALAARAKQMKVVQIEFLRVDMDKKFNINRRSTGGNLGTWCLMQSKGCTDDGKDIDGTEWVKQKMLDFGADSVEIGSIKGPFSATRSNDPFCDLILFPGKDGTRIAGIVKFTAHPVVCSSTYWEHQLGRDYPGQLCDLLQKEFSCPIMFILGPSGDHRPRHRETGISERDWIAGGLFDKLIKHFEHRQIFPLNRVFQQSQRISIPLREDFPVSKSDAVQKLEDVEKELSQLELGEQSLLQRKNLSEFKNYYKHVIDLYEGYPYLTNDELKNRSADFIISCVGFGPVRIINFPGELFHSVVREFQNQYSNEPFIVASYANGVSGYFMATKDFDEMGYEWTWALFDPEEIEKLQKYAFELIDRDR
jgi:hypothetical protein